MHTAVLACWAAVGLGAGRASADALDDLLASEVGKRHVPGIAVAVVRDGEVVRTSVAGLANVELGVPVTPRTVFQIQSITKTFTSTAVLLLVEEGKLGLDDPVAKHLPDAPESWKGVTIRHLLNHTSGIKDFINQPTASLRLEVTEEEVLRATVGRPLEFPTGERYGYSNTNYHLLAMIVRKLTGQFYGDFLRERIFEPLGMQDTRIFARGPLIPGRASGYSAERDGWRNGEFVAESILAYGGGGVLSTAPDLARWAQAMLAGRILKPETQAMAWTPAKLNDGRTSGYGLGWGIASVNGHREIGHNGAHSSGFVSSLVIYPEDRLAVVVLENRVGGEAGRVARRVAGMTVPSLRPTPASAIPDDAPEVAALLRDCLGRVAEWRLDEAKFGADLWKLISAQKESIQADQRGLGTLSGLELLSRRRHDELCTSRFRVAFENGKIVVTLTQDRDGRIVGLESGEED